MSGEAGVERDRDAETRELIDALVGVRRADSGEAPSADGRPVEVFDVVPPDWFGPTAFGGIVLGEAVGAMVQTVDPASGLRPHSFHGYFLRPVQSLVPVEARVTHLRDGRSFSARHVELVQGGKTAFWGTASFCADEDGDEYQHSLPADASAPADIPTPSPPDDDDWEPRGPLDWLDLGFGEQRADGTYTSTKRSWVKCMGTVPDVAAVPNPVALHATIAAYTSDMTGSSFRPHSLHTWGTHTDASLDHALWFHRPFRVDEWLYIEYDALVNAGARSTVRGRCWTESGQLVWSMAQELLIRELPPEQRQPQT